MQLDLRFFSPGTLVLFLFPFGSSLSSAADLASPDAPAFLLGTSEFQLTTGPEDRRPTWSPDGTRIGYDAGVEPNRDLFTIPLLGGPALQLTTNPELDHHPDWSPDGTQFVYASTTVPGPPLTDLWLIPAIGGSPALLASGPGVVDRFPVWSADGTMIAFSKGSDIYVIPAGGGAPVPVTIDPAFDAHPSFSPDGTMIAFLSDRGGSNDIWVIPTAGGVATQLTSDPANDGGPDWSADGTTIAFHSNRFGSNDIFTIPAAGGTPTRLTMDPGNDAQPAFSPTGDMIGFSRDGELWLLSLPGAGPADLALAKSVDDPTPNEGSAVEFTVILSNAGPGAAAVTVSDLLPAGVTFVSYVATSGTYDDSTGLWSVGTAAAASAETLSVQVTVDLGTGSSTIMNNAVVAASNRPDPNVTDNSSSASIDVQSVTGVDVAAGIPRTHELQPVQPNPLRSGAATIAFGLPVSGEVRLAIFDVTGRQVRALADGPAAAGRHTVSWDGRGASGAVVAPGVYFVRFESGSFRATRKLVRVD